MSDSKNQAKIRISENGPYYVSGHVPLTEMILLRKGKGKQLIEGRHLPQAEEVHLCRCGASMDAPFCDGSHRTTEFNGTETAGRAGFWERAEKNEGPAMDLLDDRDRGIEMVYREDKTHWVGTAFKVANYFPEGGRFDLNRFSPFVLMDYNYPFEFRPGLRQKTSGPHPHRGLETVSIVLEGALEHRDNAGNSGVVTAGEVQWMSTGSGILHRESHTEAFTRSGGTLHALQLWLNIPAAGKQDEPSYQRITDGDMGKVMLPGRGGIVRVVAGIFDGVTGPARTYRRLNLFLVDLRPGGSVRFNEPKVFNTGILVTGGTVTVNADTVCRQGDFVLFRNEYGDIRVQAGDRAARLILLSGEPINEPVVAQGTFVMSSQEEIDKANADYRAGVFGPMDF